MQQLLCFKSITNPKHNDILSKFLRNYDSNKKKGFVIYPRSEISAEMLTVLNQDELTEHVFNTIYLGYQPTGKLIKETLKYDAIVSEYTSEYNMESDKDGVANQNNSLGKSINIKREDSDFAIFIHGSIYSSDGTLNHFVSHFTADLVDEDMILEEVELNKEFGANLLHQFILYTKENKLSPQIDLFYKWLKEESKRNSIEDIKIAILRALKENPDALTIVEKEISENEKKEWIDAINPMK